MKDGYPQSCSTWNIAAVLWQILFPTGIRSGSAEFSTSFSQLGSSPYLDYLMDLDELAPCSRQAAGVFNSEARWLDFVASALTVGHRSESRTGEARGRRSVSRSRCVALRLAMSRITSAIPRARPSRSGASVRPWRYSQTGLAFSQAPS